MIRVKIASVIVLIVYMALGCSKQDTYEVFLYPNRDDLTVHKHGGTYTSVDSARTRARNWLRQNPNGDYEIGKNCETRPGMTVKVCEETFR